MGRTRRQTAFKPAFFASGLKNARFIREAIAKRGDSYRQVRLFIDGHCKPFGVKMEICEHAYPLITDGAMWPNLIESAVQQAGVSLQYGNAASIIAMLTGEPTRAQRMTFKPVSQAGLHAEAGLASVACATRETLDCVPFHCFGPR